MVFLGHLVLEDRQDQEANEYTNKILVRNISESTSSTLVVVYQQTTFDKSEQPKPRYKPRKPSVL